MHLIQCAWCHFVNGWGHWCRLLLLSWNNWRDISSPKRPCWRQLNWNMFVVTKQASVTFSSIHQEVIFSRYGSLQQDSSLAFSFFSSICALVKPRQEEPVIYPDIMFYFSDLSEMLLNVSLFRIVHKMFISGLSSPPCFGTFRKMSVVGWR